MSRVPLARRVDTPSSLPAEEIDRRRKLVSDAEHSNLMEGLRSDPRSDAIFDDYINGNIEMDHILHRLDALYKPRQK